MEGYSFCFFLNAYSKFYNGWFLNHYVTWMTGTKILHSWLNQNSSCVIFRPSLVLPFRLDQAHSVRGQYMIPVRNGGTLGQYKQVAEVLCYLKFLLLSSDVDILMREGLDHKTAGWDFCFSLFFTHFFYSLFKISPLSKIIPGRQLGLMFDILIQCIPPMPLIKISL